MASHVATYNNGGQQSTSAPSIANVVGSAGTFLWVVTLWQSGGNCTGINYGATPLSLGTQVVAQTVTIREGFLALPAGTATVSAALDAAADNVWVIAKVITSSQSLERIGTAVAVSGSGITTLSATLALPPSEGILLAAAYHRDTIQSELSAGSGGTQDLALEETNWGSTGWSAHDITSDNVQMNWGPTSSNGVHMIVAAFGSVVPPFIPVGQYVCGTIPLQLRYQRR